MTLYEYFKSWPFTRQVIVAVGSFFTLCAILVAVYFYVFHRPYRALYTNLRPADAATVVGELDKKKTPYQLQDGGSTILVPEAVVDQTRLSIINDDLPIKGMVGFELFNKSDMGLTEFAQKINYQRALQGELARTIMTLEAVDAARVHLSLPEPTIFRDDRRAPKASVTIMTRQGKSLTPGAVGGIRRLIAAAVPDLNLADVVIVDERGDVLGDDVAAVGAGASPELQQRQAIEQYYTGVIREALAKIYPNTGVVVAIPDAVSSTGGGPSVLSDWTPSARRFRLSITVADAANLSPNDQENVRRIIQGVIGSNGNTGGVLGDVIMISPASGLGQSSIEAPPARLATPLQNEKTSPPNPAVRPGSASDFWVAILIALLVPLGFIAGLITRRSRPGLRLLTEQERNAYTDRFRALLAKEA